MYTRGGWCTNTQSEESVKRDNRGWENLLSIKSMDRKGNEGGGGESKGGRTANKMAKEAQTQKQHASFGVVQLELDTMRTKPEG